MNKANNNNDLRNSYVDRVFYIFRNKSYSEIAQILGISKGSVGGWRKGSSMPRIPELNKICHLCHVDSDWFLTGKTNNLEAITYILFPEYTKGINPVRLEYYEHARNFSGWAIFNHNKDRELYMDAIKALSSCLYYAQAEEAPDPFKNYKEKSIKSKYNDECLYFAARTNTPYNFFKSQVEFIASMKDIYIEQEYSYSPTANSNKKSILESIIKPETPKNTKENSNHSTPKDFYEIPYFPDGIAAGNPKEVKAHPDGVVILHKDWCSHPDETSAAKLAATAHSMEPTIMAGSIVTIDHTFTDPKALTGEVVAIYKKDDGISVKRLQRIGEDWIGTSDNPAYDAIKLEEDDKIVGLVTTHHNKITNKR